MMIKNNYRRSVFWAWDFHMSCLFLRSAHNVIQKESVLYETTTQKTATCVQLLYWTMFLKRIRNAWNISLALKGIFVQLLFTCLYIIKVINQCVKHISVKLPAMLTNNVYFCHRTCWYRFIMRLSVGFEIFKLELFKNTLIIILRNKWTFCRVKCMSGGKKHLETIKHKSVKTNTS